MAEYKRSNFADFALKNIADADEEPPAKDCSENENSERGNWTNKTEYILSVIGFAIGLGNVWRFPYLTYKNGGGAFLIPYFVLLFVTGIPLYFLETSLGQFCSQGPIHLWRAVPVMQGVGVAMVCLNTLTSIYYDVIIAYSLFYLFASFQSPLPWSRFSSLVEGNISVTPQVSCMLNGVPVCNCTQGNEMCAPSNMVSTQELSLPEQYWTHVVLQRSSGLHETGEIVWELALCLLLSTILIFASLWHGIKTSGKVVYFTATFPYVLLTILLIRGVTLEGARNGIDFYIGSQSNLTKLSELQVWSDAASQTLYSLSIAFGGVITLSSYNKFHNNVLLDTLVVTFANAATSVFAGFAIFSVLGHMAHVYAKQVDEVVQEGFALAFIAYPEALTNLPVAPLFSIMFFFMLVLIGLDSQLVMMEVIFTSLTDAFPKYLLSKRPIISVITCVVIFFLSLPCVTKAGIYWVTLIEGFTSTFVPLIVALFEIIGFLYIYGCNRLIQDIEMMIGTKSVWYWLYWRVCWYFITPVIIVLILVLALMEFTPPTYALVQYPSWGLALGWCMAIFCILCIPLVAIQKLITADGDLRKRVKSVLSPSEDWHPYLEVHRTEHYYRATEP